MYNVTIWFYEAFSGYYKMHHFITQRYFVYYYIADFCVTIVDFNASVAYLSGLNIRITKERLDLDFNDASILCHVLFNDFGSTLHICAHFKNLIFISHTL